MRGEVVLDSHSHTLARVKSQTGENQARIDGQPASKQSRYAQLLPLQTLLPGISDLVFDGPSIRREFVDWGLFHVEHTYLETARRYRKALSQRAAWLKDGDTEFFDQDPWAPDLVKCGAMISFWRTQFVASLNERLLSVLETLTAEFHCELRYQAAGFADDEEAAAGQLARSFDRDKRFATTHVGPHRADMDILLNGEPAKNVASRGQAKLIASAILLAYANELSRRSALQPVLLLDDFGAELDMLHRERFFQELQRAGNQVIATTTDHPEYLVGSALVNSANVFHVEQGSVSHYS